MIGGGLMLSLESQRVFFKICLCYVLLDSKSLNDWSLGEQKILFLSNLNVSLFDRSVYYQFFTGAHGFSPLS